MTGSEPEQAHHAGDENPAAYTGVTLMKSRWRHLLFALGVLLVPLGAAGLILPLIPGTLFLIVAAWCFANSSTRFHRWLYTHPRLGPPIRDWHETGTIPPRAKALAVTMMAASWVYTAFFVFRGKTYLGVVEGWMMAALVGAILLACAAYVLTRPSRPPGD
jgi:uncharacterized membrane protein YbaN (DUF454 family)